jgi:predicted enzyme related to lactoylglutathione lyase
MCRVRQQSRRARRPDVLGPSTFPGGIVTSCFADPEGNGILLIRPSDTGEPYASRPPIDGEQWQWEIHGRDPIGRAAFYENLFGWSFDGLNEWDWGAMQTGPEGGPNGGLASSDEPSVFFYAPVDDLRATLDRIESRGGTTLVEPWQVSNSTSIAIFTDPEGNRVGLRCLGAPAGLDRSGDARSDIVDANMVAPEGRRHDSAHVAKRPEARDRVGASSSLQRPAFRSGDRWINVH